MTELEKIQRANMYVRKLANGIDPITDKEITNDSVLNNVRLSRCFFFVSQVLEQVIDNGGVVSHKSNSSKIKFSITHEELLKFKTTDDLKTISTITEEITACSGLQDCKKLSTTTITNWLLEKGFLEEVIINDKKKRVPSVLGRNIGISSEVREGIRGTYTLILYNRKAQQFIIDNFFEIIG